MDKIEVTDADREAAAAVLHDNLGWYRAAPVRAGEMDNDSVVQAFARFERDILATRTDATPVATDVAALVEAAKDALPFMTQLRAGICLKTDGKIVDAGSAHHALSAALAPFTKG